MKKFRNSVIIIMLGTLLSKGLGLLREILLANKYGTGYISDSFIISLNIPTILITSISGAILTNYIPLLSQAEKSSKEEAKKFNGNLTSICLIMTVILIIVFLLFTENIVKIFALGFDKTGIDYLSNISRLTIFCMPFTVISYILKGFSQYKEKFTSTALEGIITNAGMILGIVLSSTEKYQILGYGVLFGYILNFIITLIIAIRNKFELKINLDFKDKYLRRMVILTLPILLNDVVWQINGIVDKSIASIIGEGYVSAINYSHYIVDMVAAIFATSLVTVFFPNVVKMFSSEGIEAIKQKTCEILKLVIFVSVPCMMLILLFSKEIIKLLFFRGQFDISSLNITATAVSIYSIALVFVCIKTILFKVFYAMQDTKSPTKSAVIAIITNIVLTITFAKPFGYKGIIIATVISSVISTIMLLQMFKKKYGTLLNKEFIMNILKITIAATIMFIVLMIFKKYINLIYFISNFVSLILQLLISALIALITYILALTIMKYKIKLI